MADISKITDVLGNIYNIKDEAARESIVELSTYVSPFITFYIDHTDGNLYMYRPLGEGITEDIDFDISSNGDLEIIVTNS